MDKVPGSYSETRHGFFDPSPTEQCFFTQSITSSRATAFIVDSGASLQIMSNKCFDSRRTGNDSTRRRIHQFLSLQMEILIRLKKQHYVSVMWTCLLKFNYLKESRVVLSLGKYVRGKTVTSYEWHPGQPSYLVKNGRNTECQHRQPQSLGGPRRPSNRTPDGGSGRPEADTAVGDHELRVGTDLPEWRATIHGRIGKGLFKFDRRHLQLDVYHTTFSNSSFRASSSKNLLRNPHCEGCGRTKATRAPCRRNPDDRLDRVKIAEQIGYMITADHKVLNEDQESRLHHQFSVVVTDLATQWILNYPCKTKPTRETQRSLRQFLCPEESPRSMFSCNSLGFIHACEELNWNHERSTPRSCTTSERRHFVSVGSVWIARKLVGRSHAWSVTAISEMCKAHWQMAPYERRFNSPFEGPNIPFEAEVNIYQISSKDQG